MKLIRATPVKALLGLYFTRECPEELLLVTLNFIYLLVNDMQLLRVLHQQLPKSGRDRVDAYSGCLIRVREYRFEFQQAEQSLLRRMILTGKFANYDGR